LKLLGRAHSNTAVVAFVLGSGDQSNISAGERHLVLDEVAQQ
jgi:hypothetical protein